MLNPFTQDTIIALAAALRALGAQSCTLYGPAEVCADVWEKHAIVDNGCKRCGALAQAEKLREAHESPDRAAASGSGESERC
jgi:hypothetical protein